MSAYIIFFAYLCTRFARLRSFGRTCKGGLSFQWITIRRVPWIAEFCLALLLWVDWFFGLGICASVVQSGNSHTIYRGSARFCTGKAASARDMRRRDGPPGVSRSSNDWLTGTGRPELEGIGVAGPGEVVASILAVGLGELGLGPSNISAQCRIIASSGYLRKYIWI